jgi:hypothetical protein
MDFWQRAEVFLTENEIVIDRPSDSRHPRFPDMVYPLDYGYLKPDFPKLVSRTQITPGENQNKPIFGLCNRCFKNLVSDLGLI